MSGTRAEFESASDRCHPRNQIAKLQDRIAELESLGREECCEQFKSNMMKENAALKAEIAKHKELSAQALDREIAAKDELADHLAWCLCVRNHVDK